MYMMWSDTEEKFLFLPKKINGKWRWFKTIRRILRKENLTFGVKTTVVQDWEVIE